jgi:hypothetical protein
MIFWSLWTESWLKPCWMNRTIWYAGRLQLLNTILFSIGCIGLLFLFFLRLL